MTERVYVTMQNPLQQDESVTSEQTETVDLNIFPGVFPSQVQSIDFLYFTGLEEVLHITRQISSIRVDTLGWLVYFV